MLCCNLSATRHVFMWLVPGGDYSLVVEYLVSLTGGRGWLHCLLAMNKGFWGSPKWVGRGVCSGPTAVALGQLMAATGVFSAFGLGRGCCTSPLYWGLGF